METKVVHIEIRFTRMTVAVLLGALVLGGLLIAGRAGAQASESDAEALSAPMEGQGTVMMATDVVTSAISYQGVLREEGTPVTGDRDMAFTLLDGAGCAGSIQLGHIEKPAVPVADGLFSVSLGFDHDSFKGQPVSLRIAVEGTEIDCQDILATPYALSLRPGAVISDTTSYASLNRHWEFGYPIPLSYSAAVYGRTTGTSGLNYGVYGAGTSGTGVYGTSGSGFGVYGGSATGTAIYGDGDVRQSLNGNGLVKAAAYMLCDEDPSAQVERSFNNVNDNDIVITGNGIGDCTIDFGFNLSERYWVAMPTSSGANPAFVSCYIPVNATTELRCNIWDEAGDHYSRRMMVTIY